MNDYGFGNHLLKLRKKCGYAQKEVAAFCGVSNKAVSKWENGKTKPKVQIIRRLAELYKVSPEELLKLLEDEKMQTITKIVLTGGPCAGKSTAMSWIQNAFTERGYTVLFVPETATEFITGGVAPWTCGTNLDYQLCQMHLQLEKEKMFEQAAKTMKAEKILIVCDRGTMDNKAYMTQEEFDVLLGKMHLDEIMIRDSYEAVFHLATAAKGNPEIYLQNCASNAARIEDVDAAVALDDKLISAWTGHPHFRVIDNSTDFEGKMKRLISEITGFLGEPEPYEIERKFLIDYPDLKKLETNPDCQKVEIIQTYLKAGEDEEARVRQRGADGSYIYFKTVKKKLTPTTRVEVEERLTQAEYLKLLMEADTSMHQIRKTRYCLTYEGQYFEIDIYPFWQDKAIVEIELVDENTEIKMPAYLHVIKEVTEDDAYKNSSLARKDTRL
ncbi:MAG: AAA family ATPase [Lachnospiraceae bacterium]|nr:AAA family ATPase [Lachnospiraceae bacterium]